MELPTLSESPKHYPNFCLSLCRPLLVDLIKILPSKPERILSIGSGAGLLEALLVHENPELLIEGVEINATVNKYLPTESIHVVTGTWDVCPVALSSAVWLFVYPRQPQIISRYLQKYGYGAVTTVIWIGPKADLPDFEPHLNHEGFSIVNDELSVPSYEATIILQKIKPDDFWVL